MPSSKRDGAVIIEEMIEKKRWLKTKRWLMRSIQV